MLLPALSLTRASTIPQRATSTWCPTRGSREPPDPATTTSSGMTLTSMQMISRPLLTISAISTADAQGMEFVSKFDIVIRTIKLSSHCRRVKSK